MTEDKEDSDEPEPRPYEVWDGCVNGGMHISWWNELIGQCAGSYMQKVEDDPIAMISSKKFFLKSYDDTEDEIHAYEIVPAARWDTIPDEQKEGFKDECYRAGEPITVRSGAISDPDMEYRVVEDVILEFSPESQPSSDIDSDTPDSGPRWDEVESTTEGIGTVGETWPYLRTDADDAGLDQDPDMVPGKMRAYLTLLMHLRFTQEEAVDAGMMMNLFNGLLSRGLINTDDALVRPTIEAVPVYHKIVAKYGDDLRSEVKTLAGKILSTRDAQPEEVTA